MKKLFLSFWLVASLSSIAMESSKTMDSFKAFVNEYPDVKNHIEGEKLVQLLWAYCAEHTGKLIFERIGKTVTVTLGMDKMILEYKDQRETFDLSLTKNMTVSAEHLMEIKMKKTKIFSVIESHLQSW